MLALVDRLNGTDGDPPDAAGEGTVPTPTPTPTLTPIAPGGIWMYSTFETTFFERKAGNLSVSMLIDFSASACEMGVLEDLTTVSTQSSIRIAFRRGRGGGDGMPAEPEGEVDDERGGANILAVRCQRRSRAERKRIWDVDSHPDGLSDTRQPAERGAMLQSFLHRGRGETGPAQLVVAMNRLTESGSASSLDLC